MKQKKILIVSMVALTLFCLASCKKQCHCYGYDGSHTYFTREEVKAKKGSCSEMIYWNDMRLYSICEWD